MNVSGLIFALSGGRLGGTAGGGATVSTDLTDMPQVVDIAGANAGDKIVLNATKDGYILVPSTTNHGISPRTGLITFNPATNLLTVTGTYKVVTHNDSSYTKTDDTYTYIPADGLSLIYYDNDGLMYQINSPTRTQIYNLFLTAIPVAEVLYSSSFGGPLFVGDIRKGYTPETTWLKNAFDVSVYRLDGVYHTSITYGSGALDADARFGHTVGSLLFADHFYDVPERLATDLWNIGWIQGSSPYGLLGNDFPVVTDVDLGVGSTGRICMNNDGSPVAISSGRYVWYFMLTTVDVTPVDRTLMFMGNHSYANTNLAYNDLDEEASAIRAYLPVKQGQSILYAVLYEANEAFLNAVKARVIDIREVKQGTASSALPIIPDELISGGDADGLHHHDQRYVSKTRSALSVNTGSIVIDAVNMVDFLATNRLDIGVNSTISISNDGNLETASFKVNITAAVTVTFPAGSISKNANFDTLVWTPPATGFYTISIWKTGTEYEVVIY